MKVYEYKSESHLSDALGRTKAILTRVERKFKNLQTQAREMAAELATDRLTGKLYLTTVSPNGRNVTDWKALAVHLGATEADIAEFTERREYDDRVTVKALNNEDLRRKAA
jgi:hypothetical protein